VNFDFIRRLRPCPKPSLESLSLGSGVIPLLVVCNPRARRYFLRLKPDGMARVTIPRGGTRSEALSFVGRHRAWLERQLELLQAQPRRPAAWGIGTDILFRGELVRIQTGADGTVRVGTETVLARDPSEDLRPVIELHFRGLASRELPVRVTELAALHRLLVRRITVRNQRSRWGSCSRLGVISLNWRLVQTPDFVRDYIILHELAHLRQLNHSERFWREVAALCPEYQTAEKWLKLNRLRLR